MVVESEDCRVKQKEGSMSGASLKRIEIKTHSVNRSRD
jgi:hypothetical protein